MLFPRLRECEECNSIPGLISQIDCKLTDLAKKQYGNIVFILNKKINMDIISDLLHYKRILQYKYCNSLYLDNYSMDKIIGRVKILINKN